MVRSACLVFVPIFGTELLKPLPFSVMKAIKVSLDVLTRWLVDPTKGWRLVANGANHVIETWNFQSTPDLGKERNWRLSSVTSDAVKHAYVMNLPSNGFGIGELSGLWTRMLPCTTMLDPRLHRGRSLFVWSLTLYVSSSGCWFVSLDILCDKPVI